MTTIHKYGKVVFDSGSQTYTRPKSAQLSPSYFGAKSTRTSPTTRVYGAPTKNLSHIFATVTYQKESKKTKSLVTVTTRLVGERAWIEGYLRQDRAAGSRPFNYTHQWDANQVVSGANNPSSEVYREMAANHSVSKAKSHGPEYMARSDFNIDMVKLVADVHKKEGMMIREETKTDKNTKVKVTRTFLEDKKAGSKPKGIGRVAGGGKKKSGGVPPEVEAITKFGDVLGNPNFALLLQDKTEGGKNKVSAKKVQTRTDNPTKDLTKINYDFYVQDMGGYKLKLKIVRGSQAAAIGYLEMIKNNKDRDFSSFITYANASHTDKSGATVPNYKDAKRKLYGSPALYAKVRGVPASSFESLIQKIQNGQVQQTEKLQPGKKRVGGTASNCAPCPTVSGVVTQQAGTTSFTPVISAPAEVFDFGGSVVPSSAAAPLTSQFGGAGPASIRVASDEDLFGA